MFSIELFAYTAIPEWGGKKLRVNQKEVALRFVAIDRIEES